MRTGIFGARDQSAKMLVWVLAAMIAFFPARGLSQAAGPGSSSPQNQPGWSAKPSAPPRLPGQLSDPQVQALLDRMAAAGVLHPKTVEQWRDAYDFYAMFEGAPEPIFRAENRAIPGPAGKIPIRIYFPRQASALPVWVFFHGGGFVTGSIDTHDTPLRAVANRCDCIVVSVAYRLAPENPFPAATDDAYAATQWVAEHAADFGGDPRRIAVGGDGAGGNLAAVVALMARDKGGPRLVSQLLIYPTLDLTMLTPSWIVGNDPMFTTDAMVVAVGNYVPMNTDLENPYISPVYAKDLRDVPPAFIITDADDPVRDEAETFATRLRDAGVPVAVSRYPNAIHGFFLMAGALDAGRKAIDEVGATLKQMFTNFDTSASNARH